jgi:general stress protein YciG
MITFLKRHAGYLETGWVPREENPAQRLHSQPEFKAQNGDEAMSTSGVKQRRGFASMPSEKQREIASKGGRAAHVKGTAHEWTPDEARSAGRKGAQASRDGRGGPSAPDQAAPGTPPGISAGTIPENRSAIPENRSAIPGEGNRDGENEAANRDSENEASSDRLSSAQPD